MRRAALILGRRIRDGFRRARLRIHQPYTPIVPLAVDTRAARALVPSRAAEFDGEVALAWIRAQCAHGPRVPGTPGHEATREMLLDELAAQVDEVGVQSWVQTVSRGAGAGQRLPMSNLFGLLRGTRDEGIPPAALRPELLLCAHWDSRPVADRDPIPERRGRPVPGANDGASGVAVLLELARVLAERRPPFSVLFAFWDGEDLGEYCYGSRLYARCCSRPAFGRWRPRMAVVLDMVGKRGLRCNTEIVSVARAPELWDGVHEAARQLGLERSFHGPARRIGDDHVSLIRAGIPSILLIDYEYPQWHTTEDTPEQCSPEALGVVGDVLLRFVANLAERGDPDRSSGSGAGA